MYWTLLRLFFGGWFFSYIKPYPCEVAEMFGVQKADPKAQKLLEIVGTDAICEPLSFKDEVINGRSTLGAWKANKKSCVFLGGGNVGGFPSQKNVEYVDIFRECQEQWQGVESKVFIGCSCELAEYILFYTYLDFHICCLLICIHT